MVKITAARQMVIDDLYNEAPEPFTETQRFMCEMFHLRPRPWDLTVHGEHRNSLGARAALARDAKPLDTRGKANT